jgi:hypothetical protein
VAFWASPVFEELAIAFVTGHGFSLHRRSRERSRPIASALNPSINPLADQTAAAITIPTCMIRSNRTSDTAFFFIEGDLSVFVLSAER